VFYNKNNVKRGHFRGSSFEERGRKKELLKKKKKSEVQIGGDLSRVWGYLQEL